MGNFKVEFTDIKKKWPFWMRAGITENFKTAEAAEVWVKNPVNQLQFAGDSCSPQNVNPTRIKIVETRTVKEFIIR